MSFHVFFVFAAGLAKPIRCPKGTLADIMKHVADVEAKHGVKPETYNGRVRWCHFALREAIAALSDKDACRLADEHNAWVRWIYDRFTVWSEKPITGKGSEKITPAAAKKFWYALTMIDVPAERWTGDYYRARMDAAYEAMRGRGGRGGGEGFTFDAEPLSEKQAAAVMILFSQWLDTHDIRLDVPNGHDCLKASCDGGYEWCADCGAIDEDDFHNMLLSCKKRGCDLKKQHPEELQYLRRR